MLWKLIFWRQAGIRYENSAHVDLQGRKTYRYGTWEALLFEIEESLKKFRIRLPVRVEIPMLRLPTGQTIPTGLPYFFAIAFDDFEESSFVQNPSVSFTVGSGASDYFGWMNLIPGGVSRSASAWTWNGVAMTTVFSRAYSPIAGTAPAYTRYIVAPTSGTVAATSTASYGLDAITFSGVDQSTPLDTNIDGSGGIYVISETDGQPNPSVSGTSHVDNSVGIGLAHTNQTLTGGTNTTVPVAFSWTGYNTAAITPAGTIALAYVGNAGGHQVSVSAMQPGATVAAPTKARLLTLLGVG